MTPVKKPLKKALIGPQYFQISTPAATNAAPTKPIGLNSIDKPPLSAAIPPFTMPKRAGIPVSRSASPPMLFDRAPIAVTGEVKAPSNAPRSGTINLVNTLRRPTRPLSKAPHPLIFARELPPAALIMRNADTVPPMPLPPDSSANPSLSFASGPKSKPAANDIPPITAVSASAVPPASNNVCESLGFSSTQL